jgi:hypothetical protein
MAIGTSLDMIIFEDQVHGGMIETLSQNTSAFNEVSGNTIRLLARRHRGDFFQETFWQLTPNITTRRATDSGSLDAVTDLAVGQDEHVSVKLNRKVGPIANTLDSFRKVEKPADRQALSFLLGTMIAKDRQAEMLNTSLAAVAGALGNQAALLHDITTGSPKTMATPTLAAGLAKMGDAANRVTTFVMHSVPAFQLLSDQIVNFKFDAVSGYSVANGVSQALGRRILMTDSSSLVVDPATSPSQVEYLTLGLTENAVVAEESEEEMLETDILTGFQNLIVRLQGEFAYNLGLKGFKWNTAAGNNPTTAALGTGSNWLPAETSYKDRGGIVIRTGA